MSVKVELSQEEYAALADARNRRMLEAVRDWIQESPDHHQWMPFMRTLVMAICGHGSHGYITGISDPIARELSRLIAEHSHPSGTLPTQPTRSTVQDLEAP